MAPWISGPNATVTRIQEMPVNKAPLYSRVVRYLRGMTPDRSYLPMVGGEKIHEIEVGLAVEGSMSSKEEVVGYYRGACGDYGIPLHIGQQVYAKAWARGNQGKLTVDTAELVSVNGDCDRIGMFLRKNGGRTFIE